MIEKNLKQLEIKWIGKDDWKRMRDFLILKFKDCDTEERFTFMLEALIGSLFRNKKELEQTRKDFRLKELTKREKNKLDALTKNEK